MQALTLSFLAAQHSADSYYMVVARQLSLGVISRAIRSSTSFWGHCRPGSGRTCPDPRMAPVHRRCTCPHSGASGWNSICGFEDKLDVARTDSRDGLEQAGSPAILADVGGLGGLCLAPTEDSLSEHLWLLGLPWHLCSLQVCKSAVIEVHH